MIHKSAPLCTICLAMLCLLPGVRPTLASGPRIACDLPLVPVDGPGFVKLTAWVFLGEISRSDGGCVLAVRQTYQLHNTDRVEAATLRLGLPARVRDQPVQVPEAVLQDQDGETLDSVGSSELYGTIWEVKIDPDVRKTLILTYSHPPFDGHFVRWRGEMSPLSGWRGIEGARIVWALPQYTTDDAFVSVEPYCSGFDGTTLMWDYESQEDYSLHELVMLSPPTWRRLNDLRASGAHRELAQLYASVQEAAQAEGIPYADQFHQILAELEAAIEAQPEDLATRLELAGLLRARADAMPDMRLNYLLLSAEELAEALELHPDDQKLADALSRAYYDAARTASETGDPGAGLTYLRKAGGVPGSQASQEYMNGGDLFLRWALSLAEQGLVDQAMTQLDGVLSPGALDALSRYAPPLASAHTEVELIPGDRLVRYSFHLYPTSADKTRARVEEIAGLLGAVAGCRIALRQEPDAAVLEVRVPYDGLDDLAETAGDLVGALSADIDLLAALVAAPWRLALPTYHTERSLARDIHRYEEQVDLTLIDDLWQAESEYARWRLIELRNASPEDESEQLEQRLALIALREQTRVWERLPSGIYWRYRVSYGAGPGTHPSFSWLVSWGQVRVLQVLYPTYRWPGVLLVLSLAVGLPALLLALLHLTRRRPPQLP